MLGRIMLGLGGLIVVALFAALLVPFFVDWSSFRVAFEDQASRMLGKKVSVHGSVDARILPFPSVTLHDVRVGQDVDGQPLVQVAQFSMDMELAPFLSGEARIFDMRIDQPKVKIRILKDGTLEWLRGSKASLDARRVVLEDVHIKDGSFEIIDEQSGQKRFATSVSANFSAGSLQGPWRGEGNAIFDGYEAKFSLTSGEANGTTREMPLRLRLLPDAQPVELNLDGVLTTAENKPAYNGKFNLTFLQEEDESEPVKAPPPGPRVSGEFQLTSDRARIPQYRVDVGPTDNPYTVTGEATLDTGLKPEFLLTADGQQIDVNRLSEGGGAQGKTGRDPAASAQRRINAFIRMAASIPIPQVPGRASLKLPAIVINDTTIRDIRLDVRPAGRGWTVDNVVATLPGRTQLEGKGVLNLRDRTSFVGDMLVASSQPSGLADWLSGRVDPAIRQLRSAGFSAKVNLTPELQRFENLELAIGAATLKGRLERQSQSGQMPNLSMALAGNEIDIDAMRALASLVTGDDAGQDILDHRIAATLKADRFTAFGVAATGVDTAFTVAQGVLSLERLNVGNIEGAKIAAKGRVEGSLLSYGGSGTVSFKSADPSRFLTMLRDRLPRHPLFDRLAANGGWYANTDLAADISVGGGGLGGAEIKLKGTANGSAVNADLTLPGIFDLTGGNDMTLTASLANNDPTVLFGQAGLSPLPFDGDGAGRLSLSVRQPNDGPAATELSFETPKTALKLAGNIGIQSDDFGNGRAHLSLKSADIEPYLLISGIGLPDFGSGLATNLDADLTLDAQALRVTGLKADLAGNRVSGELSMDRQAAGAPVTGRIDADSLDLAWLGGAVYGPLVDAASGGFSKKPFEKPMFAAADVSLALGIGTFNADALGLVSDFKGKLTQKGGVLTIDDGSGNWRGGTLSGRLMMSNGEGTGIVQLKLAAKDADLSSIVWKPKGEAVATGRVGFDATVEATGKNLQDMLHGLSGSGEMRIAGLSVGGLNAAALPAIMAGADKLQGEITADRVRPIVTSLVPEGRVDLGAVTIPVTISGGEARVQNVSVNAGTTKISGEGEFNPIDNRMSAVLGLTFDPGDEAVSGGDPTVRLNFSGPIAAPRQEIDVSAISNFLSQRAFEQQRRRVETLQASVLEKQRLRREVALYNFRAVERQTAMDRAAAEEKARHAAEEAERVRIDAQRAAAQRAGRSTEQPRPAGGGQQAAPPPFTVSPTDDLFRQPPSQDAGPSANPSLPGVGQ
ncbi:AsmA family protein [Neorhizobium alkalisoli]|uniref:AsmA-like protein n=1 Tax=Neorhizobium alkalisoli TaxID=528178 RepID=A0A561QVI2_9HYPH|nr:AsmA family protein [Neorhizobium alkalisoli]TWF54329.1 AsmA-like protein [Neorhizobium alkalisoli]